MREEPTRGSVPQAVLVVKLSALGDLFHALPAVRRLKAEWGSTIDWVADRRLADVVRCFRDVERVIAFPRHGFPGGARRFFRDLRQRRYDLILDMQGLLRSALVARLAAGERRLGPSFHREGSRLFYAEVAGRRNRNRHAVEENLDVVRYLGLEPGEPEFPVAFPAVPVEAPRPRVAVFPRSRWDTKNWPLARFAAALCALQERAGASVFLLGGTDDVPACREVGEGVPGAVTNLAGKRSLVEVGGLLAEMDLVLTNDSGPMHMAAAVGTPVLAIFGPTDPRRTGPFGARHRVLRADLPCQPCFKRECRRGDVACLLAVGVEEVVRTAQEMLASGS